MLKEDFFSLKHRRSCVQTVFGRRGITKGEPDPTFREITTLSATVTGSRAVSSRRKLMRLTLSSENPGLRIVGEIWIDERLFLCYAATEATPEQRIYTMSKGNRCPFGGPQPFAQNDFFTGET